MASYGQAVPATAPRPAAYGAAYAAPIAMAPPTAPAGTFAPGTKIQVGGHRVIIQKYLSEGGFAHVYLVKMPTAVNGTDQAVLKRVAVADKDSLRGMRIEVETMKRLKGHKAIVTYIDSHASELRGGGYEVFLLMEYCNGGGLIDFMNTRLQHRLTEPEILNIFADVAEGVACMHYLKPALLHRDLKVENVLITMIGSVRKFKLCDFGSAAPPSPAPTTVSECRLMDEDVQKHTTMQYRSPEMIDVYRKQPIDEKSDVWALGVLLYKLCYYTTPFEEQGQLAILNASYRFPSYPVFSDRLKKLIAWMLRENQQSRPNIYQVLKEACSMQGREPPVKDIYSSKSKTESPGQERSASDQKAKSSPVVGAVFVPQATNQPQAVPEVERMRRGRPSASTPPTAPQLGTSQPTRRNPSPVKVTNGDPFAALDSKLVVQGGDELSSRFPTLDQFAILHEHGTKFEFDNTTPLSTAQPAKDLSQRLTERLADDAFLTKPSPLPVSPPTSQGQNVETGRSNVYTGGPSSDAQRISPPLKPASVPPPKQAEMSRASAIISSTPELKAISSQTSQPLYQPTPERPTMISTGTMTTPPPERQAASQYQAYRFPADDRHRASSVPRQQEASISSSRPTAPGSRTPLLQAQSQPTHARHSSSSRPSLEGGRPNLETLEPMGKPKPQAAGRPRPASTYLESNLDYLREREGNTKPLIPASQASPRYSMDKDLPPAPEPDDETNIESNVDFLRSMEDSDHPRKKDRASKHMKRSSLTSLGAGTKNILAGKFGDAFKRFEGNTAVPAPPRTPSPLKDLERRDLTPIAGSEATDGRSDDGYIRDVDEMTPEMRREQEAQMLAQEEARVAAAQAEYRQRVSSRGPGAPSNTGPMPLPKSIGGVSRAISIQNKVQSLLEETSRSSNVVRTAQGYGPYADAPQAATARPVIPRKPISGAQPNSSPRTSGDLLGGGSQRSAPGIEPSATGRTTASTMGSRPMAPPKPTHLNKNLTSGGALGGRAGSPPRPSLIGGNTIGAAKLRATATSTMPADRERERDKEREMERDWERDAGLVAVDLPRQPALQMTAAERDDYIRDFQKRFPSLTSIEMVERDLAAEAEEGARPVR
ncbi:hypothetical protein B0H67DRAFT_540615 [Lasiosphaeris hirsuta]|uniref:non-specific serine/threonine protein kinase n=1 Tax=Lasiosphaeris hirsuta TaxID=260670 RepID=A0AA40A8J7_9PEZI|nr:hypothetical protein B0H67DRAFT_540615 [Lasiosphaeris hirsuta]